MIASPAAISAKRRRIAPGSESRRETTRVRIVNTASVAKLRASRGRRRMVFRAFIARRADVVRRGRDRIRPSMRLRRALQLTLVFAALLLGPAGSGEAGADTARPLVVAGRVDTPIHPAAA